MKKFYLIANRDFSYVKERLTIYFILVFAFFLSTASLSCVGSSAPIGLPTGVVVGENLYIGTMDQDIRSLSDHFLYLENVSEFHNSITPILTSVPLQLLAYHIAVIKGCNVDQPRNLAKSVTVE